MIPAISSFPLVKVENFTKVKCFVFFKKSPQYLRRIAVLLDYSNNTKCFYTVSFYSSSFFLFFFFLVDFSRCLKVWLGFSNLLLLDF